MKKVILDFYKRNSESRIKYNLLYLSLLIIFYDLIEFIVRDLILNRPVILESYPVEGWIDAIFYVIERWGSPISVFIAVSLFLMDLFNQRKLKHKI